MIDFIFIEVSNIKLSGGSGGIANCPPSREGGNHTDAPAR